MTPLKVHTFDRGDQVEIAEALIADLAPPGELGYAEGCVWRYFPAEGIWREVDVTELEAWVAAYAGCNVMSGQNVKALKLSRAAVKGAVELACVLLEKQSPLDFSQATPGVSFTDGFVWVEDGTIGIDPHSPEHLARTGYPFPYNPSAPSPKFAAFLDDILGHLPKDEAEAYMELLRQFFGACLLGQATFYQLVAVLYGDGNNGKSSLLDVISGVFPDAAVCCLQPQQFADRFRTVLLRGVLLNVVNELAEAEIITSTTFKTVVAGEAVVAEEKHKKAFRFRPVAGHVFAANVLPPVKDRSEGLWRRLAVIPLERDLSTLPHRRPNIAAEILSSEKMGIIAWLLEGAAQVQRSRKLVVGSAGQKILQRWRTESDSVAMFLDEECSIGGGWEQTSVVYNRYKSWAADNGYSPASHKTFTERAKRSGVKANRGNRRELGLTLKHALRSFTP